MDLESLREALDAHSAIQLTILFGSRARGRSGARSDVDLALRLDTDTFEVHREVLAAAGRAAGCEVDVVNLNTSPPLLRFQIARDGVVLVEREPRLWTRFKTRAMIDLWDWAPTARAIHMAYIKRLREQPAHG